MENDSLIDPEDVNSTPRSPEPATPADGAGEVEIPVPIAMSAAEIDERAQAVQAQNANPAALSDDELHP